MRNSNFIKLILIYFAVRLFSFFFTPSTPLLAQNPINTLLSVLIFILAIYWVYKNDERGWYIVAGEIILGGSGGYLKLGFISLRTGLLLASTVTFLIQKIYREKKEFFRELKLEHYLIFALLAAAGLASLRGLYLGHSRSAVFSDFIPYLFLLYYFPLYELWLSDDFRMFGKNAIFSAVIGNAVMILLTQAGLSSDLIVLQDSYYHWYRDVALGKITDLDLHFYRLVLNEHLLLVPLALYFIGKIIKGKINWYNILCLTALLSILASNLTRIYMLALAVGIICLFSVKKWKQWLITSLGTAIIFMTIFTTIHLMASRGQSLGWEFFGIRLQSITAPQIEDSSLSRLLLLPKILEKIKTHPILGEGLGDTVTVYSPVFKNKITTSNFDWGYLEIWTEMGLYGLLVWIAFISCIFYKILNNNNKYNKNIFAAILIAYLIINITSPALFHVFGILLLITLLTPIGLKQPKSAGGIILGPDNRIILVNSSSDPTWWTPPKGGIEAGEDTLTAAKREIFEESGLTLKYLEYVRDLGYFYDLSTWKNKVRFKKVSFFLFKTNQTTIIPHDKENPSAQWFTIDEAINKMRGKQYKKFLTKIKHDLI